MPTAQSAESDPTILFLRNRPQDGPPKLKAAAALEGKFPLEMDKICWETHVTEQARNGPLPSQIPE